MTEEEIRADERERCRTIIETYAIRHVEQGKGSKASKVRGWQILVAAAELRPDHDGR
jgi:hypothetical protein